MFDGSGIIVWTIILGFLIILIDDLTDRKPPC
jgi:hypothetical protein